MVRWLLLAVAILVSGCTSMVADALPPPSPQPTRPTLSLPTHPAAETALPHIPSSWELTPPPRTPFAILLAQGDLAPADATLAPAALPDAPGTPPADSQATSTPPAPTATRTPPPSPTAHVHRFAVSTRARSYYYCDTDSAWKGLSPANLRWYESERALKADYPRLTLHEPCD